MSLSQKDKVNIQRKSKKELKPTGLYLYHPGSDRWIPALCDDEGRLVIDPTDLDSRYYIQSLVDTIQANLEAEDLTFLKLDGSRVMTDDLDIGDNKIAIGDSVIYKLAGNTLMIGRKSAPASRNSLYAGIVNFDNVYFTHLYSRHTDTTLRSWSAADHYLYFLAYDGAWRYSAALHDGYFMLQPIGDDSAQAAAVNLRGALRHVHGGAGVADTLDICAKNAAGAYIWQNIV